MRHRVAGPSANAPTGGGTNPSNPNPHQQTAELTRTLKPTRFESRLLGVIDEICCGAVSFADGFDEVGAAVEDTGPVVGSVTGRQRSFRDQTLKQRTPLRFG